MKKNKKAKRLKPDVSQLETYYDNEYDLIPLHRYDYIDRHKGKKRERGKSPRDLDWRGKKYKRSDIEKNDGNTGVRLRGQDIIIDVDPRNFPKGDNVLKRFVKDTGIDLSVAPKVNTGSGGAHYYYWKPESIPVRDSLEDYPGIEFKSRGRQVVAAGSVHPNGKLYEWDDLSPELSKVPQFPASLLRTIKRPTVDNRSQGGGEHTAEQLAAMLNCLDAEDFRDHDEWLTLMQACHHATGGDGRAEFIEWSTRDHEYSGAGWEIGRRWDSLDAKQNTGVTVRTLHKIMRDAGYQEEIPASSAKDDFEDVGIDEPIPEEAQKEAHERLGPLERMNLEYIAVNEHGKFKIYQEAIDPTFMPPRKFWQRYNWWDFEKIMAAKKIQKNGKPVPLAPTWLQWGGKREAKGIIFDPEKNHPGFLNLWQGWGVEPRKGDWSMLQELIYKVLSDSSREQEQYVLNWMADMTQRPGQAAEVAICFQGKKGTGKSTLGRMLCALAGRHGLHITSPDHLTGRFNSHLRDVVFLFADEAVAPHDREANSRLKGLITEPTISLEGKGVDLVTGRNLVHVMMASNEEWFVPAGLEDERRFYVAKANELRRGDRRFFEELNRQMRNGGLEAMLWDLLRMDVSDFRPRTTIPGTAAMVEQKMRNMSPVGQWWFARLIDGQFDFPFVDDDMRWDDIFPVKLFKQDIRMDFEDWCRKQGIKPGANGRANDITLSKEIKELAGPGFKKDVKARVKDDRPDIAAYSDGRAWAYQIPCLDECRKSLERKLGGKPGWPGEQGGDF